MSTLKPQQQRRALLRPLTQHERERLLWDDLAGFTPLGTPNHAILALLIYAGLRARELCTLTLDAVRDEACRTLLVQNTKDGHEREVELGPTAASALWQYLHDSRCRPRHNRETERALFVMENGRPLDRRLLEEIVRAAGERARLEHQSLTVHGLRLRVFAERRATWAACQRDWGTQGNESRGLSQTNGASDTGNSENGGVE